MAEVLSSNLSGPTNILLLFRLVCDCCLVCFRERTPYNHYSVSVQHQNTASNNISPETRDETGTNPAHGGRQRVPESVTYDYTGIHPETSRCDPYRRQRVLNRNSRTIPPGPSGSLDAFSHILVVWWGDKVDIDHEAGIITVAFVDVDDTTPVADIKPYLSRAPGVYGMSVCRNGWHTGPHGMKKTKHLTGAGSSRSNHTQT